MEARAGLNFVCRPGYEARMGLFSDITAGKSSVSIFRRIGPISVVRIVMAVSVEIMDESVRLEPLIPSLIDAGTC